MTLPKPERVPPKASCSEFLKIQHEKNWKICVYEPRREERHFFHSFHKSSMCLAHIVLKEAAASPSLEDIYML